MIYTLTLSHAVSAAHSIILRGTDVTDCARCLGTQHAAQTPSSDSGVGSKHRHNCLIDQLRHYSRKSVA